MSQTVEIYQHKLTVDSNQSVRLYYKGDAFKAELYNVGCKLDECEINEKEGFLNLLSDAPLHCGLVKNNEFKIKFYSYSDVIPTLTYVVSERTLTWEFLETEKLGDQEYFVQNVELTNSKCRKNNMLLYVGNSDCGFCGLRYA